jgi:hypothetical protein
MRVDRQRTYAADSRNLTAANSLVFLSNLDKNSITNIRDNNERTQTMSRRVTHSARTSISLFERWPCLSLLRDFVRLPLLAIHLINRVRRSSEPFVLSRSRSQSDAARIHHEYDRHSGIIRERVEAARRSLVIHLSPTAFAIRTDTTTREDR